MQKICPYRYSHLLHRCHHVPIPRHVHCSSCGSHFCVSPATTIIDGFPCLVIFISLSLLHLIPRHHWNEKETGRRLQYLQMVRSMFSPSFKLSICRFYHFHLAKERTEGYAHLFCCSKFNKEIKEKIEMQCRRAL